MESRQVSGVRVVDVQQFIDARPLSTQHWVIFALCFLMMVADGFDVAALGFAVPAIMKEWSLPKEAFGLALTSSVIGLALGAIFAGPLADRFGRRPVLLVAVAAFGVFSVATTTATSLTGLAAWRFLVGLGLGAATPNATTLLAEWVPARHRSFLLNGMYCGFTLGAAAGGFLAGALIPINGWRSVFVVGGIVPLALVLWGLSSLPESTRFMVVSGWSAERVRRVLGKLGGLDDVANYLFIPGAADAATKTASPWSLLFAPGFKTGTLMLWLAYFMGTGVFFLVASWLPTLIKESGISLRDAAGIAALFPLGGAIGTVTCGRLMDRMNPHHAIAGAWLLAGLLLTGLAAVVGNASAMPWMTFLSGLFTGAALVSTPALAAAFYPTAARASGVAWMTGVGRLGGIGGAYVGAVLLAQGFTISQVLQCLALPAIFAAAAIAVKGFSASASPARVDVATPQ